MVRGVFPTLKLVIFISCTVQKVCSTAIIVQTAISSRAVFCRSKYIAA